MFICNFKINKKKFIHVFTTIIVMLAILLLSLSFYKIFISAKNNTDENKSLTINSNNYTNFLKECHENIDKYVGTTVTITGYVYRMPDFNNNQFVLARTMLINSNNKAVVVGILCESSDIKNYKNSDWITCTGVIEKGDYHGDMPVLKVSAIEASKIPDDDLVYAPTD